MEAAPATGGLQSANGQMVSAERSFAHGGGEFAAYLISAPFSYPPFAPTIPTPAKGRHTGFTI